MSEGRPGFNLRLPLDADPDFGAGCLAYIEAPADGHPTREVVLNPRGEVVHRAPDDRFKEGRRGIYDAYPLHPEDGELISATEFELLWERSADESTFAPPAPRRRWFSRRRR